MDLKSLFTKKQTWEYLFGLGISGTFLITCFYLISKSGILSSDYGELKSGEISISGKWKVFLEDDPKFSSKGFDDSSWCEIGVPDPYLIPKGAQSGKCKDFYFDPHAFQNKTIWYRKKFKILPEHLFKNPTLFLGSVKEKAYVFWDGKLISVANREDAPVMITLPEELVKADEHVLAIKVKTDGSLYPGIIHLYKRGIAIGEYQNTLAVKQQVLRQLFLEPIFTLVIQLICLLVSTLIICYGYGISEKYRWLNFYFGSSAFLSMVPILKEGQNFSTSLKDFLTFFSVGGILFGTVGFSKTVLFKKVGNNKAINYCLLSVLVIYMSSNGLSFYLKFPNEVIRTFITKNTLLVLFLTLFSLLVLKFRDTKSKFVNEVGFSNFMIHLSMLFMGVLVTLFYFVGLPSSLKIPIQMTSSLLSIVIILISTREFLLKERTLSFFGRFIRPGLGDLIKINPNSFLEDKKVFRARKIPIVKIDIVGHTELTFGMPYGMKRSFQDLWFSLVDQEFKSLCFLDKNIGDGSIYCIDEKKSKTPCTDALRIVLRIKEKTIHKFWSAFKDEIERKSSQEPPLKIAVESFLEKYQKKTHKNFWDHDFQIYAALVFGYVDEGLWGELSQSHYDVQGDLVTLVSRLEGIAKPNEVIVNKVFAEELQKETSGFYFSSFVWQEHSLKGIGSVQVGSFKLLSNWEDLHTQEPEADSLKQCS